MRTILCVLTLFIGFSFAEPQELIETATIAVNDGEISDIHLERNTGNNQHCLVVSLHKGGLKVYGAKRDLVFQKSGIRHFVHWGNTYLHNNNFYFFESQELYALSFDNFKITKLHSAKLLHDLYTTFRAYKNGASDILVAENDTLIDAYEFPDLDLMAHVKRSAGWYTTYVNGMILYSANKRELYGFAVSEKKTRWKIDAGEMKATFMGISLGTLPLRFMSCYVNPDDSLVYTATWAGDLYKINPTSGQVVLKKERFRGNGNNAGLLTRMYFQDMTGDGKPEIVSPSVDENIYCIDPKDFSVKWMYEAENENQTPLAFYDITGDGIPEVFSVCDYDLMLSILDGPTGNLIKDFELKKEHKKFNQTYVLVADIDGNGYLDVITQSSRQKIRFLELKTPRLGKKSR